MIKDYLLMFALLLLLSLFCTMTYAGAYSDPVPGGRDCDYYKENALISLSKEDTERYVRYMHEYDACLTLKQENNE